MAKKKIDELFQKKFKDFEQMPDDKVWQGIAAALDKKKKRGIPLWWKLGGVAAVLTIGLLVINPFSTSTDISPVVTDIEQQQTDSVQEKTTIQDPVLKSNEVIESQITASDVQQNKKEPKTSDKDEESQTKDIQKATNDLKLTLQSGKQKSNQLTAAKEVEKQLPNKEQLVNQQKSEVVSNESKKQEALLQERPNQLKKSTTEVVVQNDSEKGNLKSLDNGSNVENKGLDIKELLPVKEQTTRVAQNENEVLLHEKDGDTISKKKSIYDEIVEQEEALAANESKNKWSAGPSIAPVYYDAFGEGSPVHSILVPNSKSGNTNLSYGLSVAYEISPRLSVRSGIHKVDYGYDTGEIEFSSSLDGAVTDQMNNIDYASTARNLVVKSKAGNTSVGVNNESPSSFDVANNSVARSGSMSQEFGYLEVPIELNYAIVDKKVGVNIIGGFSSLFLIENSISLTDGNQTTQMGEANNVNSLNFSTNIGLGVNYEISPKVKLNVEPVFKYQLNTFEQVEGTFNPFSVGIYSGLTFRF